MNLDNPYDVVMHYLLIEGMTCFEHYDEFPMVGALECMLAHWTRLVMNNDIAFG